MTEDFERLRKLFPQSNLTDVETGQVKVTRAELERLRAHYARAGIDLSKAFASDRELLQRWTDTLTDEECNLVADILAETGLLDKNWREEL